MKQTIHTFLLFALAVGPASRFLTAIDVARLPDSTTAVFLFDHSQSDDPEFWESLQEQIIRAVGFQKELEQFLFLSDLELSEAAEELLLFKVTDEKGSTKSAGVVKGSFSESSREAFALGEKLMAGRDFRLVRLGEDEVVFGSAEAVMPYAQPGEVLAEEVLSELRELNSQSPLWGWMRHGWADAAPPEEFSLGSNPVWSLTWARDQITRQSFTVLPGSTLQFHLEVTASDPAAAIVLQDELNEHYQSLTRWQANEDLEKVLEKLSLSRQDSTLNIDLDLEQSHLEEIGKRNLLSETLKWQTQATERESWQKVGDLLAALEVEPGSRVADVGAGYGFLSVRLARAVGKEGKVWAVDIDSDAVEWVQQRAASIPCPQLAAIEGKAANPRLPKIELDAILVVNAYHEMEKYRQMLRHFFKALKPGGKLVVAEPFNTDKNQLPRSSQVKDHVIAPALVESELSQAGFLVQSRDDDFLERWKYSLIVAARP